MSVRRLVALAAAAVAAVLGQAVIEKLVEMLGSGTASWLGWVGTAVVIAVAAIGVAWVVRDGAQDAADRDALRLSLAQLGLRVDYYPLRNEHSTSPSAQRLTRELQDRTTDLLERAGRTGGRILRVVSPFWGPAPQGDHLALLEAAMSAVERYTGTVEYVTVLQTDAEYGNATSLRDLSEVVHPRALDHLRSLVDAAQRGKRINVGLRPSKYPHSFYVVQPRGSARHGGHLIWPMFHVDGTPSGVFVIDDPQGVMLPTFISWFNDLEDSSHPLRP